MLKKDQRGFTIIEVLIVLAIAGVIMLVVFLAVPALQRTNRNNAYKSEANRFATAYNEVVANKGGSTLAAGTATATPAATPTDADKVRSAANPKDFTTLTIAGATPATVPTLFSSTIYVVQGQKCSAPDSWTLAPGSTRQAVTLFTIETRSGISTQCQEI